MFGLGGEALYDLSVVWRKLLGFEPIDEAERESEPASLLAPFPLKYCPHQSPVFSDGKTPLLFQPSFGQLLEIFFDEEYPSR